MAARLTWKKLRLVAQADEAWLDGAEVGRLRRWGVGGWAFTARVSSRIVSTKEESHETSADARQDCEREVRRLLKESGVDCE